MGSDIQSFDRRKTLLGDEQDRREEALVNRNVRALRVLDPPLVRNRVARVRELEPVPFEDEADGTVLAAPHVATHEGNDEGDCGDTFTN